MMMRQDDDDNGCQCNVDQAARSTVEFHGNQSALQKQHEKFVEASKLTFLHIQV